jgi:hypothetical protein
MADQLYLSYWLERFREQNMLRRYEKLLRTFPFSRLSTQGSVLRIYAVDQTLPPVFERIFEPPVDPGSVISSAGEFLNADTALELESQWDLWQPDDKGEWKLSPSRASLICYGPEFTHELDENIRIEFGMDANFLPQPELANHLRMAQSNIRSLLKLTHDLDDALGGERRLWSESGENFAEKLQRIIAGE